MTGHQNRRQRTVTARQFGNDVARWQRADRLAFQHQIDLHRLASARHAGDQVGVGVGYRTCGNGGDARSPAGTAGVRIAVAVGPDRANHHARRALAGGERRSGAADLAIGAIGRAILGRLHRMVDERNLPLQRAVRRGAQRVERREIDQRRGQPARRGRGAVAQRGDRQLVRIGRSQAGGFGPAHPAGNRKGFDPHVGQPQRFQAGDGPVARGSFAVGPGQTRAHFGSEVGGDGPGDGFGRSFGVCGGCQQGGGQGERGLELDHAALAIGPAASCQSRPCGQAPRSTI